MSRTKPIFPRPTKFHRWRIGSKWGKFVIPTLEKKEKPAHRWVDETGKVQQFEVPR